MLVEQTMEKLVAMKLKGMAEALRRWMEETKEKAIPPLDLIGLLADAEWSHREQRKLTGRLRNARFRQEACIEDIDYQHPRGVQKATMRRRRPPTPWRGCPVATVVSSPGTWSV